MVSKWGQRVYLVAYVGTRKNETTCDNQQRQRRRVEDIADTLVPPSCIIYAFRIGCLLHVLHLSVNAGMENARFLPALLLPPPSVLTSLSPSLTSSLTTNGRKLSKNIFSIISSSSNSDGAAISGGTAGECLLLERPDHLVDPSPVWKGCRFLVRWRHACNRQEHGGLSSDKQQQADQNKIAATGACLYPI